MNSPPPLSNSPCPPKTRADLEWDRLLEAICDRCVGPMGRALALSLPFAESREEVRRRTAEAREATLLLANGEPLPVVLLGDVRDAIGRARVGGVLGPLELRAVGELANAARTLRRFLATRKGKCPALFLACSTDPSLDSVADELRDAFDPDGALSDRASPRLAELRGEQRTARQRMRARLEEIMGKHEAILTDKFVTEREGRYVIPVRSDSHERFPGIVHATSASGATLFVEPRVVIPMGNRLKVIDSEVQREEIAIYGRLTSLLTDVLPSLEACADALAVADVRAAVAVLAEKLELTFPVVVDDPVIELVRGRHPLLVLDLPNVVASDLAIATGEAMVVSGPNAGGKTVALKTLGLAALMVRAGLPVACGDGSRVGIFDAVLTDVGDDQNLQRNLSTFSAHVTNLVHVLSETQRGTLVLLDELAGGTDPREGEALAAGVLDSLTARGGAVVATTHYEGLKALALADPRFTNASVGFNLATLSPTFRVTVGVPGSSSALAVARRYGMPSTVIERAERFLSREDVNFETVVKRLNDERAALELSRQAADEREAEARAALVRLEGEIAKAKSREKALLSREGEELLGKLRRAKDDVRDAQSKLRHRKDEATTKDVARSIDRIASDVAIGGALESAAWTETQAKGHEPLAPGELRRGARVYVPRVRAEADVLELLPDGTARVAAGAMKLTVRASELLSVRIPEVAPAASAKGYSKPSALGHMSPAGVVNEMPTDSNSCDLRGLRVDDAMSLATSFLDRCLNAGQRVAFLIHGHGTGALRDAIRTELKASPYVERFRPGESGEGGDGVTVVWLK